MVQVSWDVDNLKVLWNSGKVDACCCSGTEYATSDCCCFLNPDTDAWSSGTTYANGDLCEYSTKTWESLQDNNTNHTPAENTWWHKVSDAVSCGNTHWNDYSPYGGPGKTPKYVSVTFSGITRFSGYYECSSAGILPFSNPNRTFILTHIAGCNWGCGALPDPSPYSDACAHPDVWPYDYWLCHLFGWEGGYTSQLILFHGPFNSDDCCVTFMSDEIASKCSVFDGGAINNAISTTYSYLPRGGYQGTASINPGRNIVGWSFPVDWVIGNTVIYNDIVYICKITHTSSSVLTPTNTTYWAVLTECT